MSVLRIFSYLPNPRVWKATIAARLCDVAVEVRGASADDLAGWLWDFDARPISRVDAATAAAAQRVGRIGFVGQPLYKTDAFLAANPFGTVPAAFSSDGEVGVFESNSIMRAVARLGANALYGEGPYEASRIDSFLDVSLVFARDAQIYLFALRSQSLTSDVYARAADALAIYLGGLEAALAPDRQVLCGRDISLADVCFACELALFHNERPADTALAAIGQPALLPGAHERFPRTFAHFERLIAHPAFASDLGPYLAKLAARNDCAAAKAMSPSSNG
jgi:elongation factor 1-gamma